MKTKTAGTIIFIFVVAAIVSYACLILYLTWPISEFSVAKSGVFGDSFGVVNALFSGLAFAGLIVTILLQRDEIHLSRISFERQQFEATFFNLISLYSKNLSEIRIAHDDGKSWYSGVDALSFLLRRLRASVQSYSLHVQNDHGRIIYEQELFQNAKSVLTNQARYLSTLQYLLNLIFRSVEEDSERERYIQLLASQFTAVELKYLFYRCLVLPSSHELVLRVNQSNSILTGFATSIVTKTDIALYERLHKVKIASKSTKTDSPYPTKLIRKLKKAIAQARHTHK